MGQKLSAPELRSLVESELSLSVRNPLFGDSVIDRGSYAQCLADTRWLDRLHGILPSVLKDGSESLSLKLAKLTGEEGSRIVVVRAIAKQSTSASSANGKVKLVQFKCGLQSDMRSGSELDSESNTSSEVGSDSEGADADTDTDTDGEGDAYDIDIENSNFEELADDLDILAASDPKNYYKLLGKPIRHTSVSKAIDIEEFDLHGVVYDAISKLYSYCPIENLSQEASDKGDNDNDGNKTGTVDHQDESVKTKGSLNVNSMNSSTFSRGHSLSVSQSHQTHAQSNIPVSVPVSRASPLHSNIAQLHSVYETEGKGVCAVYLVFNVYPHSLSSILLREGRFLESLDLLHGNNNDSDIGSGVIDHIQSQSQSQGESPSMFMSAPSTYLHEDRDGPSGMGQGQGQGQDNSGNVNVNVSVNVTSDSANWGVNVSSSSSSLRPQGSQELRGFGFGSIEHDYSPTAPTHTTTTSTAAPSMNTADLKWRFLTYQILSAVSFMHEKGAVHGNISPKSILLTQEMWCRLSGVMCGVAVATEREREENDDGDDDGGGDGTDLQRPIDGLMSHDFGSLVKRWCYGEIDNYTYLLVLNEIAGRRRGHPDYHTIMPWVIDFTVDVSENENEGEGNRSNSNSDGYRDLSKTKYRLVRGDMQLDFTFENDGVHKPHHVTDFLSAISVYMYQARRMPVSVLTTHVRAEFQPKQYPRSMSRMYAWSNDECIPEFYDDPSIFTSIHEEMPDIQIPTWASSIDDFLVKHRAALNSQYVSDNLHRWIDLVFGYKLAGAAAVQAKNVMLADEPVYPGSLPKQHCRAVQLFKSPHPRRQRQRQRHKLKSKSKSKSKLNVNPRSAGAFVGDVTSVVTTPSHPHAHTHTQFRNAISPPQSTRSAHPPATATATTPHSKLRRDFDAAFRDTIDRIRGLTVTKYDQAQQQSPLLLREPVDDAGEGKQDGGGVGEKEKDMDGDGASDGEHVSVSVDVDHAKSDMNGGPSASASYAHSHSLYTPVAMALPSGDFLPSLRDHEYISAFALQANRIQGAYGGVQELIDFGLIDIDIDGAGDDNDRKIGFAADIFSVGCVVAEMYLGHTLFTEKTLKQFLSSVNVGTIHRKLNFLPFHVRHAVKAMLSPDWTKRPSASALLMDCRLFPEYFSSLHKFISAIEQCSSNAARLSIAKHHLMNQHILSTLPDAALPIVLAHVHRLMTAPDTKVESIELLETVLNRLDSETASVWIFPLLKNGARDGSIAMFSKPDTIRTIVKKTGVSALLDSDIQTVLIGLLIPDTEERPLPKKMSRAIAATTTRLCSILGPVVCARTILCKLLPWISKSVLISAATATATVTSSPPSSPSASPSSTEPDSADMQLQLQATATIADSLVFCIVSISQLFGESLVASLILPYIFRQLKIQCTRAGKGGESVQSQLLAVIEELIPLLTPSTIERLFLTESNVLFRMLLNPTSQPSVMHRLVSTLLRVCKGIGRDRTMLLVLPYIDQYFAEYESASSTSTSTSTSPYSPPLVLFMYSELNKLVGRKILKQHISNIDYVEYVVKKVLRDNPGMRPPVLLSRPATSSTSTTASASGASSDQPHTPDSSSTSAPASSSSSSSSSADGHQQKQKSKGVYSTEVLEHLLYDIAASGDHMPPNSSIGLGLGIGHGHDDAVGGGNVKDGSQWQFSGKLVHSFAPVGSSIKSIASHASERVIVTGCRDGNVHVWRLDDEKSLYTYKSHSNLGEGSIHFASFCDSVGSNIVTAASSLHLWDAETGVKLHSAKNRHKSKEKDSHSHSEVVAADAVYTRNRSTTSSSSYSYSSQSQSVVVCGTSDETVALVDFRSHNSVVVEWEMASEPLGSIRCVSASATLPRIAVGWSSGVASFIDWRTGILCGFWKAHDTAVSNMLPFDVCNGLLVTCGGEQCNVWNTVPSTPKLVKHIRGRASAISCATTHPSHQNALFVAGGHRVGIAGLSAADAAQSVEIGTGHSHSDVHAKMDRNRDRMQSISGYDGGDSSLTGWCTMNKLTIAERAAEVDPHRKMKSKPKQKGGLLNRTMGSLGKGGSGADQSPFNAASAVVDGVLGIGMGGISTKMGSIEVMELLPRHYILLCGGEDGALHCCT